MHDSVHALWNEYLDAIGETPETTDKTFQAWHFCDNEADANELAKLVLDGTKRATTPSVWELEAAGEPVPAIGDHHVVTDWDGVAQCVIRTTDVDVVRFDSVPASHAEREGEGDGSLAYWRQTHWDYYHRVLADTPHRPALDMPVVCEQFEVVFRASEVPSLS